LSVYITERGILVTHDEGVVVVLKLRKTTTGGVRGHSYANGPLIDSSWLVFLEKRWSNERLKDKPATEVDAERFDRDR
jgi:hypothetical protein